MPKPDSPTSAATPPEAIDVHKSQNCPSCQAHATNPLSGRVQMTCPHCCARLVAKTRPSREQAKAMLAAIAWHRGSPPRALVLELVDKQPRG